MSDSDTDHPGLQTPPATDTGERTTMPSTPTARTADGRTERKRLTRLALGELPANMRGAGKTAGKLRLALEAAVIDRHGDIDLVRAGLIVTACRWERHAAIAGWLLRQHAETMTHAERLTYSREIARASAERDKAVAALKLEQTAADVFDALYATPPITDVPPAADARRSPATSVGDVAGNLSTQEETHA